MPETIHSVGSCRLLPIKTSHPVQLQELPLSTCDAP